MSLLDYGFVFAVTLVLSTVFALGGVGSAIALVPIFSMLGLPLNLATAIGLFVNTASTMTASVANIRQGLVDFRFALPLVASVVVATPTGVWLSQYVAEALVQWVLAAFLMISAGLMLLSRHEAKVPCDLARVMLVLGGEVGRASGLIGVGGATRILAVLLLLGFDPKKAAFAVSFVIPFATLGFFFTYLGFVQMNWPLLGVVSLAAIVGGFLGQGIMHLRFHATLVKKVIGVLLLLLAGKMLWPLFT